MQWIIGLLIIFLGTSAGAAGVFFLRERSVELEKVLLGFAAGVMTAASIWSLLLPAIDGAESWGRLAFVPAAGGFAIGFGVLMWLNRVLPEPEFLPGNGKAGLMTLAITLHNIPEGMAVGAAFAGVATGEVLPAAAMALAVGIGIQNVPEGAIISMPLAGYGMSRSKAFGCGVASGMVEPVAGVLMLLLTFWLKPLLPWCLAFAAGAMMFVVAKQLLPDVGSWKHERGIAAFAVGFLIMMILDVALG